jgi:hypothetical protein
MIVPATRPHGMLVPTGMPLWLTAQTRVCAPACWNLGIAAASRIRVKDKNLVIDALELNEKATTPRSLLEGNEFIFS